MFQKHFTTKQKAKQCGDRAACSLNPVSDTFDDYQLRQNMLCYVMRGDEDEM